VVVVAVVERDRGLVRGSRGTWLEADMVALLWWWVHRRVEVTRGKERTVREASSLEQGGGWVLERGKVRCRCGRVAVE
jgi:hypothetical protein